MGTAVPPKPGQLTHQRGLDSVQCLTAALYGVVVRLDKAALSLDVATFSGGVEQTKAKVPAVRQCPAVSPAATP